MSTPYEQAVEAAARFTYSYETPRSWETADDALRMIYRAQATRHVSAALPSLLAPIEALAGVLDAEARAAESMPCTGMNCGGCARGQDASRLRAALASIKGQPS